MALTKRGIREQCNVSYVGNVIKQGARMIIFYPFDEMKKSCFFDLI